MKLIDEKKFKKDFHRTFHGYEGIGERKGLSLAAIQCKEITSFLSKHTKDLVDEPHHPSGMDRHDINVRNALLKKLRELDNDL